jgi:hypothetical protein
MRSFPFVPDPLLALLLGLAATAQPSVALACGQCLCPARDQQRVAPSATADVPRNVRFLVDLTGLDAPQIALTDAVDQPVALTIERAHPSAEVFWVSAQAPLAPMAKYRLSLDATWSETFQTGASSNERAPEIGALTLSAPISAGAFCEAYDAITLELASFIDHGQPHNRGVLQVDFGEARGLFPLHALSPTRSATIGDGDAACFGAARIAGLMAGVAQRVDLTFWDSSGHATRLEDVELTPQRAVPDGCWPMAATESGDEVASGDPNPTPAEAADGCRLFASAAPARGTLSLLAWLAIVCFARRRRG